MQCAVDLARKLPTPMGKNRTKTSMTITSYMGFYWIRTVIHNQVPSYRTIITEAAMVVVVHVVLLLLQMALWVASLTRITHIDVTSSLLSTIIVFGKWGRLYMGINSCCDLCYSAMLVVLFISCQLRTQVTVETLCWCDQIIFTGVSLF